VGKERRQTWRVDRAGDGCIEGERHHQEDHGLLKSLPGDVDGTTVGEDDREVDLGYVVIGSKAADGDVRDGAVERSGLHLSGRTLGNLQESNRRSGNQVR